MTQKEKFEKLDKELRPKYEHLSDYEYQQVRTRYIKSQARKFRWKFFFRGLLIPLSVGLFLIVLLEVSGCLNDFTMLLLLFSIMAWIIIELCRSWAKRNILPTMDAGLLTFEQVSKVIGGTRKWQSGKYRLVVWTAIEKEYISGGVDDSATTCLVFANHSGKLMKQNVNSSVYEDMKMGDRYYLLLAKNSNGEERILQIYKEELITLDNQLKAMLQK